MLQFVRFALTRATMAIVTLLTVSFISLRDELRLTILFISHDLSVVAHVCDMVAVMYLGAIVEAAPARMLFAKPRHPYTSALFSAIPSLDPDRRGLAQRLIGEIPSAANVPPGCRFHTRSPMPNTAAELKCQPGERLPPVTTPPTTSATSSSHSCTPARRPPCLTPHRRAAAFAWHFVYDWNQ